MPINPQLRLNEKKNRWNTQTNRAYSRRDNPNSMSIKEICS